MQNACGIDSKKCFNLLYNNELADIIIICYELCIMIDNKQFLINFIYFQIIILINLGCF